MVAGSRRARVPSLSCGYVLLFALGAATSQAQQASLPELTLDQAIDMALHNNASVASASFETRRSQEELASQKTQRYPQASVLALGGELLTKPKITFDAGAFGTFPATGPIPAKNTTITIPRNLEGIVVGSVEQPLTKQYQLHLELRSSYFGLQATREDEHRKRQEVIDEVRQAYYSVVEAQSQLESRAASLPYYRESKRVAAEKRGKETILESELLNANAQLIEAENSTADAADQLANKAEKLNDLLGRDVHLQFKVTSVENTDPDGETIEALEARSLANRPDVKKVRLKEREADYSARAEKAEYIPEVSVSFDYVTSFNYTSTLPRDITTAGFLLNWTPWDWGKRLHEVRAKRAQQAEAKVSVNSTERSVVLDVRKAWRQLENSRRKLTLSEANLLASRQKLAEVQSQVQQQQKLTKDLFSAQSDLASADYQHQQALTGFWQARADLKKATGDD